MRDGHTYTQADVEQMDHCKLLQALEMEIKSSIPRHNDLYDLFIDVHRENVALLKKNIYDRMASSHCGFCYELTRTLST